MRRSTNWFAIVGAAVAMAIVAALSARNWDIVGSNGIDLNGWIALILGVLVTLAVGIGLMALIFISNRRGYDEPPSKDG